MRMTDKELIEEYKKGKAIPDLLPFYTLAMLIAGDSLEEEAGEKQISQ